MSKKIAVYGVYEVKIPIKQRFWKKRIDGILQRYWKKTKKTKTITKKGRYEFEGTGRELYQAVFQAHRFMPKGFVDIPAREFLKEPEKWGEEGSWIDKDVES